uniref:EF-hand domain-containing protein n=1 Tax=Pseudo-nitzschia australis TaxID=44445 RepID=A0A6U9XVC2_9STRA|mmetsp:Transcript_19605/g.42643  ORF Transcript_19605/g.42643 Transcript_19605/m.42643 type:complete len:186 (+) Transcript_19605:171-728(+)
MIFKCLSQPPKNKRKRLQSSTASIVAAPPEDLIEESRRQEILLSFKTAMQSYNGKGYEANTASSKLLPISCAKKVLKKIRLVGLKSDDIKSYFDDDYLETIDADMFLRFAAEKSIQMDRSNRAFQLMDEAEKGVVVFEDLQRVCSGLGEDIKEDELIEMIEFADSSGEGLLRPKHFFQIAHKVNL